MFSASDFPCQPVLFKELFEHFPKPEGPGGGGLLRKANLQVNQPSELSEVPKAEASEAAENQLEKRRSP
ncbi:hypothetical protein DJ532_14630, partial [Sulfolobus sp. A20-N-F8]